MTRPFSIRLWPAIAAMGVMLGSTWAAAADTPAVAAPSPSAPVAFVAPGVFPPVKAGPDGTLIVGFEHLASYTFPVPPDNNQPKLGSTEGIPEKVRELDGKRVSVEGYMLPMKMADGLVTHFLLIRSPMVCCYGAVPTTNEWIVVKMKTGTSPMMDVPIKLSGTLHVGAVYDGDSFAGIYTIEGEKVAAP